MNNKKCFYKIPIIQMLLLLLLFLIFGLIFLVLYCERKSNTYVTYVQDANTILTRETPLYVTFSTPEDKIWEQPDHTFGAQYDGKFYNNTLHTFTDWTVTIKVQPGYWVDSNWNANFSFFFTQNKPIPEAHKVYTEYSKQYKSDKDVIIMKKIPSNKSTEISGKNISRAEPFMLGMIMYTQSPFKIQHITITGRFIHSPFENPLFSVLIAVISITLISLFILVSIQIVALKKIKYYEAREKLDSDIIVQSFKTFANFVDAKDPYTKGHSLRVAHYAREIARRLHMSEHGQKEMFWCGLMHDVGKISITDTILNKPDRLDDEEYSKIQIHTTKGYEMLKDFDAMPILKEVAKSHHEHWDGSGYCEHLKGLQIPLEARIVCVCDSFDAMNSNRCYDSHKSREIIIEEFEKGAGTHFDPKIAKIMIEMIKDKSIDKIENVDTLDNINYKA